MMFEELPLTDNDKKDPIFIYEPKQQHAHSNYSSNMGWYTAGTVLTVFLLTALGVSTQVEFQQEPLSSSAAYLSTDTTAIGDDKDVNNNWVESFSAWGYKNQIAAGPSVIFTCAIGIGFLVCFFGYRLIKPTLFSIGFVAGAVLAYDLTQNAFTYQEWGEWAVILIAAAAALLLGITMILLYHFAIFILGAVAGIFLAEYLHVAFLYAIYPSNPSIVLYVCMGFFGVIFGLFAALYEKPIAICFTSWIGSFLFIRGIGYFAGGYPIPTDLQQTFSNVVNASGTGTISGVHIDSTFWYYFFATLAMCVAGILIQIRITARNVFHTMRSSSAKKSSSNDSEETPYQLVSDQPTQLC